MLIPANVIINKVISDFRPAATTWYVDGLKWIEEGLKEIGYNSGQTDVRVERTLVDGRAVLPCSLESLLGVYYEDCWLGHLDAPTPDESVRGRKSVHNIHWWKYKPPYVVCSMLTGTIEIHYLDFERSDDGAVMVPDFEDVKNALAYKIMMQLILQGMPHHVLDYATAFQMWEKYLNLARGVIAYPSPYEYDAIMAYWNNVNGHSTNNQWK